MKLASVRALKQELFAAPDTVIESVTASSVMTFGMRTDAARRQTARDAMRSIALGAVRVKKDYKLAIRQQEMGPIVRAVTDQIRAKAKGEIDERFIGRLVPFQTGAAFYRARRRPLRIGASISDVHPQFITAGTLGCFVIDRKSPHYLSMLSNNHVIAGENATPVGGPILQPGTLDDGADPADLVGELHRLIKLKKTRANFVDAALAAVYDDVPHDLTTIGSLGSLSGRGDVALLPEKATVHKVGRTTGQTRGRITAFDLDNVSVTYDIGDLSFDNQIEIEGTGNRAFSDSGDSGSLIVDDALRAIGLLFAGGDVGGSNGKGLTYANPIQPVLDALKVDLYF